MSRKAKSRENEANDTALYAQLFAPEPTKGQRRMIALLDAAIESYATLGIDETTFDSIAKAAGVSRPLVQHYFKTKRDVFLLVIRYIRAAFQAKAIEAIRRETEPDRQFEAYVRSTFEWMRERPKHALVWSLFYYYCGLDPEYRTLHTDLVRMGETRITALLEAGRKAGVFARVPEGAAKQIQAQITGALITLGSENHSAKAAKAFIESSIATCRKIAGC